MRRTPYVLVVLVVLAALSACSGSAPTAYGVRVQHVLGTDVLAEAGGRTLYVFAPDRGGGVTCVQVCQGNWPPMTVAPGAPPTAGAGIDQSLLGTAPDPGGGTVATYAGWPLYTYAGENGPGQTRGHAVQLNGGAWFLLTPGGRPV